MKTKRLLLGTLIAGILTIIFGGKTFATAGNTAEISGDKTWNICVDAGAGYAGSDFAVNIAKTDFASQIVLGNGDCKSVEMAAGTYTVSLNSTMGVGAVSYETTDDTLTFSVANSLRKYLNTFGSIAYTVEGSGESPYELLFSMPGECQFNGNANVSGETCKDGDGNPLTNKKYIDTNVALFSEENAGRDFEVYFTLTDYASTQIKQGTLFNAKYENSSMYYPGFTIRTVNTDGGAMEITGRLGKDNTNADKANNSIVTADIKNKEVKIVRVGGMVSYSIDGGEMIPFQNYKNFSRYFNQTAVFGASMQTNGNPQRYYDGTIKNIRVYLKKVPVETTGSIEFQANGGTGSMATIEGIEVGTDVVLPMSTLSMNNANFTGWNTKSNGTGAAYADGATITINEPGKLKLYAQWEGTGIAVLDKGLTVNKKMKSLANSRTMTYYYDEDTKIKTVAMTDELPDDFDISNSNNVISDTSNSPLPIYIWFDNRDHNNDGAGDGIMNIYTIASAINGGADMGYMFAYEKSLTDISPLAAWNVSGTVNMENLFYNAVSLVNLSPMASWDMSNVNDIGGIFGYLENLSDISPLANWDVSNVEVFSRVFYSNKKLVDISPLARWNTSNAKSINGMFEITGITNTDALETKQYPGKDYVSWNVSGVKNMGDAFKYNEALSDISALSSWDTSSVEDLSGIFYKNTSLSNISALSNWDTSEAKDMSYVFAYDEALSNISPLASWNTSKAETLEEMLYSSGITNVNALETRQHSGKDYVSWDISKVKTLKYIFCFDYSLSDISALASWDTSSVEDMTGVFAGDRLISNISALASWNTSRVKTMLWLFQGTAITNVNALETKQYSGKNYVSWDTSNVENMQGVFVSAESLSNISALASWNTSKVETMEAMFHRTAITNANALETKQYSGKDYVSWDMSCVKSTRWMFRNATNLSDISALASWNTSSLTNIDAFLQDTAITNVDALRTKQHAGNDYVSWDVSKVKDAHDAFDSAKQLSDISALASWNLSVANDISYMFYDCVLITDLSPLNGWNISSGVDTYAMFYNIPSSVVRPDWY